MTPPITVAIGDRDVTGCYSDLSYSNVDPGGFEQLQITVSDARGITPGQLVTVRCGLETSWRGRVNEIGDSSSSGKAAVQIAALGEGAKLTDKRMSMIYVDRDLSRWQGASTQRRVNVLGLSFGSIPEPSISPDSTAPSLRTSITGEWTLKSLAEAWYDAGPGNAIGRITATWTRRNAIVAALTDWHWSMTLSDDDQAITVDSGPDLRASGPSATALDATTSTRRYAVLQLYYNVAPAGDPGTEYPIDWSNIAIHGTHGLTRRGAAPQGYYPGDIAKHAHDDSGAGFELVMDDTSSLIVGHSVYRDRVPHATPIDDMAKLMGWHWGVWEPRSVIGSTGRLLLTAPPAVPTAIVARQDITGLDAPKVRVDKLYDTAQVKWTDPAGTSGVTTVTIANPLAQAAGVQGRVLDLEMGQGDAATAAAYGAFALQLALTGARGGGSGTIPDVVALPGGGSRPACLLKSGRDRLRILDLPDSGALTAADSACYDAFLVRRAETTVRNGQPSTRVEFDGGADLLEVLNSRLALAASTPAVSKPSRMPG